MSWDIFFVAADAPPAPSARMPEDWFSRPIGTCADLRERLSGLFPGTDWTDPAWGVYEGERFTLEFNIGENDPCDGFAVHVRGRGDAVDAVRRIAEVPGWYGADPVQGEWLHHTADPGAGWRAFQNFRSDLVRETEEDRRRPAARPARIWSRLTSFMGRH